ncbi:DNA-binding transcriptional LysR family regulator [Acidovorax temperans]|uniref:DNA-binding transcriptional LysR family regulator n=1 Tax=Acidovorax temperans TaxID=80878 RepID=A0A543L1L3_9BURK|nr:LysR family transcriptional regulator [Acidovorax temperans]MBA4059287.1 LysR family transcriptional regulator [Verminephrobacter sp.]MBO0940643.1 LysR family transcriptional regulator [Acidovorax temperans]TQN01202.1 DNA-binding transcriptional LysR family regulator [Acidovorax temperans]HRL54855.1 LysR family transcriptional regulator [Acidovorax temperans]HRM81642.1 LysR family transcriptional regulator [Acidovorax temperans]
MQNARDVLTPDSLTMLQVIAEAGSFAAAARQLGLVPSALTYRVRQIEDALDVLLFDRSARQAKPTEAGAELLREGGRLLQDIDAVANRVRRVATGWEPQLTLSIDGVISPHTMLELVEAFYAMSPPTRLKLRDGIMSGTREALTSGRADLAIGVSNIASDVAGLQQAPLGDLLFIYVVAPHHPLASMPEPITDAVMLRHRAVAVADSAQRGGMTMGLLGGQDVLTVDTMQAKVQVQLRGLGGGFLPEPMVRPYLEAGRLVAKRVARPERQLRLHYAWGGPGFTAPGRALQWWLQQLQSPATRKALLENHHHF